MIGSPPRLAELRRRRADCEPWLSLLELTLREIGDAPWSRGAHASRLAAEPDSPLLASATLAVEVDALSRHVQRLTSAARGQPVLLAEEAAVDLLGAALDNDHAACPEIGGRAGVDGDVLRALLPLVAMPILHACRARWSELVVPTWTRSFCPVCGAWPALAEVRGLDRTRGFRCLRCASAWAAEWLVCPYCRNDDHTQLGALVAEAAPETRRAETCKRCLGYLKSIAVLQATAPDELGVLDVETLELDVAAVEEGYQRPPGLGHRLDVRIDPRSPRVRGRLGWLR